MNEHDEHNSEDETSHPNAVYRLSDLLIEPEATELKVQRARDILNEGTISVARAPLQPLVRRLR
jgi:hypothetical protein